MVYRTIGYNGVPHWCLNIKWERRGLWWLDSRHNSEHNIGRGEEKDEGGRRHRKQAGRQLQEPTRQARRNRRRGEVDLGSRCEAVNGSG
jgi:hypothetical protein